MKNFFMVSGLLYTLSITLAVISTYAWPSVSNLDTPPTPEGQSLMFVAVFALIIAAFTSFIYGLWDKYVSKNK